MFFLHIISAMATGIIGLAMIRHPHDHSHVTTGVGILLLATSAVIIIDEIRTLIR